jgi:hypothetical protein
MTVKMLPLTSEIEAIARRVIWFEEPEQAIAIPARFLAYAMTYGDHRDMSIICRYLTDDDLREALDNAPPGIFDARSWAYWNVKLGRYPTPPMPKRRFQETTTLGDRRSLNYARLWRFRR